MTSVSILLTTFNRPNHLRLSLETLCRQDLEGLAYEIVVINDATEDETESIVSRYAEKGINIKYLFTGQRNKNGLVWRVPGFALNIAIQQSDNEIIVLTGCDTYHLGNTVRSIVSAVEDDPWVLSTVREVYEDYGNITQRKPSESLEKAIDTIKSVSDEVRDSAPRASNKIPYFLGVHRERLLEIGGYDEDFIGFACEDDDLVSRLQLHGCHYVSTSSEVVHLTHEQLVTKNPTFDPAYAFNLNLFQERQSQVQRNIGRSWGVPTATFPVRSIAEIIKSSPVLASICVATYDRPEMLEKMLASIYRQQPTFKFETIVVDDHSPGTKTQEVCKRYPVKYIRIPGDSGFKNPCLARNVAYRAAVGDIIIAQSDEVLHVGKDTIQRLVYDLRTGHMLFANVFPINERGGVDGEYVGPKRRPLPFFFLGSLFRSDLYAIGGNDEEFAVGPAGDDRWFADCLLHGLHVIPTFSTDIVGHHQYHASRSNPEAEKPSLALYARKYASAVREETPWCSSGGAWEYKGKQFNHPQKQGINSIVVCVEYDDFLAITLPKNRQHFDRTVVVTTWDDKRTQEVAYRNGCECFNTVEFMTHRGQFNKGAALEAAFDQVLGRVGWICIWDADIIMPDSTYSQLGGIHKSSLYVPERHILENVKDYKQYLDESTWKNLPVPTQPHEFSGYFQLFYAAAIPPPWYSVTSRHAGCCDSDFAAKFSPENRRRPPFRVLHLGREGIPELSTRMGENWMGRVTPRIDTGEVSSKARKRQKTMKQIVRESQR